MTMLLTGIRIFVMAFALLAVAAAPYPANAQQPNQINPTAQSVKEDQLLNQFGTIRGRGSIPDTRSYTIEQPAGRDWRHFHEVTLRWIGAIAIVGILAVLVIFYLWRGMVRIESGRSGRKIVRFTAFERLVHWMTATCFIALGLSGLNVTFGKPLLLPLIGPGAFSAWSEFAKYVHYYLSFPFTLGVVLIFLMWIAGNIPNAADVDWLKRGGGMVGHDHPPAARFNAGQKAIYWIVVLHAIVAVLFVAAMLAHIYIGTIGMEGAFEAMGSGTVDVNWAREHHSLWVEEKMDRIGTTEPPRQPIARPAE